MEKTLREPSVKRLRLPSVFPLFPFFDFLKEFDRAHSRTRAGHGSHARGDSLLRKIGLIAPARREANNYRSYGEEHVRVLDFIRHCRNIDLGLEEIRTLLDARAGTLEEAHCAHELIHEHLKEVDARIADLLELKGHLEALAARCGGDHSDGRRCAILEGLESGDAETGCCTSEFHERPERTERLDRFGERR